MVSSRLGVILGVAAVLLGGPARARDDEADERARKVAEKVQKALRKAEERERRERAEEAARAATAAERERERLFDEIEDRAEDYVDLHDKAARRLFALPDQASPAQVVAHQAALAERIRALRPHARPGDIFVPESQPLIKRIIASDLDGVAGAAARKRIVEANPPIEADPIDRMHVRVAVNAAYPEAAPLSGVPPSLLLTLPRLPREVEYRFVGRDLVLRDVAANMIVDFITEATPPLVPPTSAP
jgi:hypothetical protein